MQSPNIHYSTLHLYLVARYLHYDRVDRDTEAAQKRMEGLKWWCLGICYIATRHSDYQQACYVAYRNAGLRSPISASCASVYFARISANDNAARRALMRLRTIQYANDVNMENTVIMTSDTEKPVVYSGASGERKMFDPSICNGDQHKGSVLKGRTHLLRLAQSR